MRRHRNYSIVHEVNNLFLCFYCEFRALYFNSRLHKVHQPVQTQMVVTPLPELLSKSSLLQGGRKEDSSWFVLRNHLLALSFKDNVNACLLLRSTILLVCCSTMYHVGVDSDDNGLNLLSTTQCLSASVCKVIGAPAAHRQSLPFLYDVNSSGKERRKLMQHVTCDISKVTRT